MKQSISLNWQSQLSLSGALQILFYFLPLVLLLVPHMAFAADSGSLSGAVDSAVDAAKAVASAMPSSADSGSLSFKPHAGDQSVIFLGNIFGVVDGVLAGTGSQIAGQMFGVFNTAVLSLAGILITYTLLVSTLNTAQEGQFLGQRWSSIWVPMRSIAGVTLLLPKASGYCVLQIFVMWVVLQGIGAADKVWSQALSYLNRGGSIVKPNIDPVTAMASSNNSDILNGAYGILAGQVCMIGLEKSLASYQSTIKNDSSSGSKCTSASKADDVGNTGSTNNYINTFCTTSIPNFIDSVDLASDDLRKDGDSYLVPMPNLDSNLAPYNKFNGICGYIKFKPFSYGKVSEYTTDVGTDGLNLLGTAKQRRNSGRRLAADSGVTGALNYVNSLGTASSDSGLGLTSAQEATVSKSRNIAMGQMYIYLAGVAASIMDNAQNFNSSITCNPTSDCVKKCTGTGCGDSSNSEYYAQYPFGMPVTLSLGACTATTNPYEAASWDEQANELSKSSSLADGIRNVQSSDLKNSGVYKDSACLSWDLIGGSTSSLLLRGNEIKDAVSTYNGMMSASLYIKSQAGNAADYRTTRKFIAESEQKGWLLAGAYYFRLAILTSQVLQKSSSVGNDTDSGLQICTPLNTKSCGPKKWSFDGVKSAFDENCSDLMGTNLEELFCLKDITSADIAKTTLLDSINTTKKIIGVGNVPEVNLQKLTNPINNSTANTVFGYLTNGTALVVPGQPGNKQPVINMNFEFNPTQGIPEIGNQNIEAGMWNIPGAIITFVFNNVIKHMFNFLLALIVPIVNTLFFAMITPPLMLLASVFQGALEVMQNVNVNPIIALANMGVKFIEGSSQGTILIMAAGVGAAAIGLPALALLMMVLPIVGVWLGIMLTVGLMTAFYIPLIPFLIFLFTSIGWIVGVIEAMVAAPLVALGIMNPEGDQAFGKGDQAIMLILGVFLRPAMMIMGYIFGIILSYVGIWFVNAGFSIVIPQVENMPNIDPKTGVLAVTSRIASAATSVAAGAAVGSVTGVAAGAAGLGSATKTGTYGMWSTIFLYFFLLLIYVTTLITVVSKAFELIYYLPDNVLRWLSGGSQAGQIGSGAAIARKGMDDAKSQHKNAASQSSKAMAQMVGKAIAAMPKTPTEDPTGGSDAEGGDLDDVEGDVDEVDGDDLDTEVDGEDLDTEVDGEDGTDGTDTEVDGEDSNGTEIEGNKKKSTDKAKKPKKQGNIKTGSIGEEGDEESDDEIPDEPDSTVIQGSTAPSSGRKRSNAMSGKNPRRPPPKLPDQGDID